MYKMLVNSLTSYKSQNLIELGPERRCRHTWDRDRVFLLNVDENELAAFSEEQIASGKRYTRKDAHPAESNYSWDLNTGLVWYSDVSVIQMLVIQKRNYSRHLNNRII